MVVAFSQRIAERARCATRLQASWRMSRAVKARRRLRALRVLRRALRAAAFKRRLRGKLPRRQQHLPFAIPQTPPC